jgi:GDP-4-dehydro-6-deoxy-D-mannose reductase
VRAVVTGASGFVGRHLIAHLEAEGDTTVALDRHGPVALDVTDARAVHEAIAGALPVVVYHLAELTLVGESCDRRDEYTAVNVGGTRNVVDASTRAGVGAIVVIGSAEAYGAVEPDDLPVREDAPLRPRSPYGETKVAAEAVAREAHHETGAPVVVVRPFNHTGPGQPPRFMVPALAARIAAAELPGGPDELRVGNLDPVRDISDVRDVVRAYRLVARHGRAGEVYNVCAGRGVSVRAVAVGLLSMARRELRVAVDPALVRPEDVPVLIGDSARIRAETGWAPEIDFTRTLWEVLDEARRRAATPRGGDPPTLPG